MPSRTTFFAGFAAGYVLGARAGRERYEQIASAARGFARNPKVQETAGTLQSQAADLATQAKDKVSEKVSSRRGADESYDVVEVSTSSTTGLNASGSAGSNGRIGT